MKSLKKLELKKNLISKLNAGSMQGLHGGGIASINTLCGPTQRPVTVEPPIVTSKSGDPCFCPTVDPDLLDKYPPTTTT